VAFGVYEDILRFQIAVCNTFPLVEELEDKDNLGSIELRGGFVETPCSP
jgi:hypothetical protein